MWKGVGCLRLHAMGSSFFSRGIFITHLQCCGGEQLGLLVELPTGNKSHEMSTVTRQAIVMIVEVIIKNVGGVALGTSSLRTGERRDE
jgi:hypothetical protein